MAVRDTSSVLDPFGDNNGYSLWKLDGDLIDVGLHYSGTQFGTGNYVPGKWGNAYNSATLSDHIILENSFGVHLRTDTSYTFSFHAKPLLDTEYGSLSEGIIFSWASVHLSGTLINIYFTHNKIMFDYDKGSNKVFNFPDNTFSTDEFYNFTFTRAGQLFSFYFDNELLFSHYFQTIVYYSSFACFGVDCRYSGIAERHSKITLDQIRLYSGVLNATQLAINTIEGERPFAKLKSSATLIDHRKIATYFNASADLVGNSDIYPLTHFFGSAIVSAEVLRIEKFSLELLQDIKNYSTVKKFNIIQAIEVTGNTPIIKRVN